jgi:putative transcriptional regulator
MKRAALLLACLLACFLPAGAAAQQHDLPNSVLLIAKADLLDPNFREAVVLATRTRDGQTVGVILNRPTQARAEGWAEPLYEGGPVLKQTRIALFHAATPPAASAFHVLPGIYLSMHPDNVGALLSAPGPRMRLFAGFAGWAPRQLESELERDGWHVLPASENLLFLKDTAGMWRELLERARALEKKTPA